ncbi:hypothetical protein J437_LFUL018323, partial [Ladona fulva]
DKSVQVIALTYFFPTKFTIFHLFQESRENRVNSWKAFQASGSGKNKKFKGFKPPKHKAESRYINEKKKKLKREGRDPVVDEDDPVNRRHAVYVMTMRLFADMERRRRDLEQRDMEERKRKREQEIQEEQKATLEKEWQKNFEVSLSISIFFVFKHVCNL